MGLSLAMPMPMAGQGRVLWFQEKGNTNSDLLVFQQDRDFLAGSTMVDDGSDSNSA
jgi:hypothetical protein